MPAAEDLPSDVLAVIFSFLSISSRLRVARLVSKTWRSGVRHRAAWSTTSLTSISEPDQQLQRPWLLTDDSLGELARFWEANRCGPCELSGVSAHQLTSTGLFRISVLPLRHLSLQGVQHVHLPALQRLLTSLSSLATLQLRYGLPQRLLLCFRSASSVQRSSPTALFTLCSLIQFVLPGVLRVPAHAVAPHTFPV